MTATWKQRWSVALIGVSAAALALAGCSSSDSSSSASSGSGGPIVIATTNFSETQLLANMYQQMLESKGITASIKELTTREVIEPALSSGEVQLTPEYLGTLTEYLNKKINGADAKQLASGDVQATYQAAKPLAEQENITLLEPSPAQDQNAFAVTSEFASAHNLKTLSDLATYSQSNPVTLGGPPECPQRPFCQPGLEQTYGIKFAGFTPLDAGGPLTVQALSQGTIDVGLLFSSSGSIAANDFVVLEDDKQLQTADNVTPALYTPAVTDQITQALNAVSAALTTSDLQQMNQQIEVDRKDPAEVAKQFLADKGLVQQ